MQYWRRLRSGSTALSHGAISGKGDIRRRSDHELTRVGSVHPSVKDVAVKWRERIPLPDWSLVFALYLALGVATIGRHAIGHLGTVCACTGGSDPALFMWALSWWPHALAHGLNPFVTHYQWAPSGVNVAQGTMIPTAALLMAPLTAVSGPVASYNVLCLASVVLSALTAYLLCRRLVRRELPAMVGGYLYGFSAYNFAQLLGHINLTLIFLFPVMIHLAVKRFAGELSPRVYVTCAAGAFLLQAGLSTELLAEAVVFGAVVAASARFFMERPGRARLDRLVLETMGAGVLAVVVGAPFFYYAAISEGLPKVAGDYWNVYAMDFLNPLFPTEVTWLGHGAFSALSARYVSGGPVGADGYLSIPLVVAFCAWGVSIQRKRLLTKLTVIVAALSFILALGAHLHVAGRQTIELPGGWIQHWPIVDGIIPERLSVFTSLAVAVGIAAWVARPAGSTAARASRWLVVAVAVVMLWPNITTAFYGVPPRTPRFFATDLYKRYLSRDETVLILPYSYNDVSTLWQAETGFYFYMPEGYAGQIAPEPFISEPVAEHLLGNVPLAPAELEGFVREHYVSHIVVDGAVENIWADVLASLGMHGERVGGVLIYTVPSSWRIYTHPAAAGRVLGYCYSITESRTLRDKTVCETH